MEDGGASATSVYTVFTFGSSEGDAGVNHLLFYAFFPFWALRNCKQNKKHLGRIVKALVIFGYTFPHRVLKISLTKQPIPSKKTKKAQLTSVGSTVMSLYASILWRRVVLCEGLRLETLLHHDAIETKKRIL